MIAILQRVKNARVDVDDSTVGKIDSGLLILIGIHKNDSIDELLWVVKKTVNLRIFPDEAGLMNKSLLDVGGEALVVSQFTLYGDTRKGNRPSFMDSAPPEKAEPLYEQFIVEMNKLLNKPVATGIFGAKMDVHLINDGPVTLTIEKKPAEI